MDYERKAERNSPAERFSSSVYSSASEAGGGYGGGADGDVEESSHATLHESFVSRTSTNIHNETANGTEPPDTPQTGQSSSSDTKGKKKLSRDSFKNMGKAIGGAFTESTVATKFKKHRGKKNGTAKPTDDVMAEQTSREYSDRNMNMLETISSRHSDDEGDNDESHHLNGDDYMQPSTSALRAEAAPLVDSTTRSLLHDEEKGEKDPEIVARERELERTTCTSITLVVILAAGVVLGIIFCAMMSLGAAFQILGPTILGLSAFALVYKLYVTFFWKEDPYRYCMKQVNKCKSYKMKPSK